MCNKKIIFLLPPSEAKKIENKYNKEKLSFNFKKPINIAINVSEKDLKCSWKRFQEWINLNIDILKNKTIKVIKRYSWVMYNSINYEKMKEHWKIFFEEHFFILSWMYWILKPLDKIGNYKLPIESKGLLDFWWTKIIEKINKIEPDFVVNLLPISYSKLIFWKNKKQEEIFNNKRQFKIVNINFLKSDWNKISHWVKKIKWEWINNICNKNIIDYNNFIDYKTFGWEIFVKENNIIDINLIK